MMAQWHPTKNPQFDVNTTAAGTKEKAWWLCSKCGYEWQALISTRKESKGYCPKCDKDKQGPKTTVTIAMVPHLMDYFDQDANPDIDPYTLTATKRKKANWKCPVCGYKWSADINARYYEKTGCLACLGRATVPGMNDVLTLVPEIEYYYDAEYPDNPDLRTLRVSSKDVVHWACPDCGRKWEQSIRFRIGNNNGKYYVKKCSHCSRYSSELNYLEKYPEAAAMYSLANKIPFENLHAKDRTYAFLWDCPECGYEFESSLGSMLMLAKKPHKGCPVCLGRVVAAPGESLADLYPELLDELDDDTDLYKVLPYSSKEIHWKCNTCGYKWITTAALRHMGFGKCPACSYTHPIKGYNTVADLFIDIAKQWSSSNKYRPDELMPSSGEVVRLICPDCGGEHSARVYQAAAGKTSCPYCSDKFVLPGFNSFAVKHPDLLEEWDYTNNYILADPDTISEHCRIRVWFRCRKHPSHDEYEMTVEKRVRYKLRGQNPCPMCKGRRQKKKHFV